MRAVQTDELLDLVLELQHDLGKYIRMPVAFLPAEASDAQLREALRRALFATRSGPDGDVSARQLWESFTRRAAGAFDGAPSYGALSGAVEQALGWEEAARSDGALDRQRIGADLGRVGDAIRALVAELDDA